MPSGRPVFYASREVGCATLDSDNRGFVDTVITLADGSQAKVESDKETTTLRCIEPGHYEVGVNLYAYRDAKSVNLTARNDLGLKTHVEIIGLNPTLRTLFSRDVTLDKVGQTINVTAFDIGGDGKLTLGAPRLTPVNDGFQRVAP